MAIKLGTDIVHIPTFRERIETPGVLETLFTVHELATHRSVDSLAGRFAAKEALIKALGLSVGTWHALEILTAPSGKPYVRGDAAEISISHDGDYAFAVAVCVDLNACD